jgi:hypothetical protein
VLAPDALIYGESFPAVILPPRSASLSGVEAGKEHQSNRGLRLELKASFHVLRSLEYVQDCDYAQFPKKVGELRVGEFIS